MTWSKTEPAGAVRSPAVAGLKSINNIKNPPMTWSKEQIRLARKLPLAPLLQHRGFTLREMPGDNLLVREHPDLIIRDSYWIWKSRNLQGNAIDFLVLVENMSFAQAMEILCPKNHPTTEIPS